jgi:hypothetical protein
METDRRKPGWKLWLIVALVALPVLYVGSFVLACWRLARAQDDSPIAKRVIMQTSRPLGSWLCRCSKYTNGLPERVINAGMPRGTRAILYVDARNGECEFRIRQRHEETRYAIGPAAMIDLPDNRPPPFEGNAPHERCAM